MKLRLADWIAKYLVEIGIKHIFMLTGGGSIHLNDAFGHNSELNIIFNHHEQACAMAAESYTRISGKIGVINVTTGPGGINALNGVFGAWTDSIPLLILSGQVKSETCLKFYDLPGLRQLGDQEANIVEIVKPITKYSIIIKDPNSIKYHLEKAIFLATQGRPGPVWIDIPIDIQGIIIDTNTLENFDVNECVDKNPNPQNLHETCSHIIKMINSSSRPVILTGSGIRIGNAIEEFHRLIEKLKIPITTSWTHDIIASNSPFFCGRPGSIGTRPGNFTVQNSDLLLILGSRLNIRQTGYNYQSFAKNAYKIQVDIDREELLKPTIKPDLPVICDIKIFLQEMLDQLEECETKPEKHSDWLRWSRNLVFKYPAVLPKHKEWNGFINPYFFIDSLIRRANDDAIFVCGNASACIIPFQTAWLKPNQRLFSNSGSASMGYDLPAAIGATIASNMERQVICFAGDGSIQLNIQELQTIEHYKLPIIIFVLNNNGYLSIRLTQSNFFGRRTGESFESGITFPNIIKIGKAYNIPSIKLNEKEFITKLDRILHQRGPLICEVILDPNQGFEPKLSARLLEDGSIVSASLEDMFPFLDKEELESNFFK